MVTLVNTFGCNSIKGSKKSGWLKDQAGRQAGRLRAELWWELRIKEDTRCLPTWMQELLHICEDA